MVAALLTGLLALASGPVAAAPASCTVVVGGATSTVSWAVDAEADSYVVSRSIDGGPTWWRGRTIQASFEDSSRTGAAYVVQSRAANGSKGDMVSCTEMPIGVDPLVCIAAITPAGVEISWSDVATDRFVVRRSVDAGTAWWRGRTNGAARSFTDTARAGALVYSVSYRQPGGPLSEPTVCADDDGRGPKIDAVAFGDMVTCGVPGPERVAALVDTLPGFILGLGDFSYEEGTIEQFRNCFDPVMGRHVDRIEPVPGNHEYRTPNAAGYFEYFGAAAGDPTKGYYERTKGNWQILYLNSSCWEVGGCGAGDPQQVWLDNVLSNAPAGRCRIAIMHHPRWSSWGPYASQVGLDPIFSLLHGAGTDMVLTGHAHHYERLIELDANGNPDPATGFRQFTIGTGGTGLRTPAPADVLADSNVLITGEWGVLDLDLYDHSYDWRFVTVDNAVLDSGTDTCIN